MSQQLNCICKLRIHGKILSLKIEKKRDVKAI